MTDPVRARRRPYPRWPASAHTNAAQYPHTQRLTDRPDRQTGQTDQTDRQKDQQTDRQTDRQTDEESTDNRLSLMTTDR